MSLIVEFKKDLEVREFVCKEFEALGLHVVASADDPQLVIVEAPSKALENEAERIYLCKYNDEDELEEFTVSTASRFKLFELKSGERQQFSPSEANFVLMSRMCSATVNKEFKTRFSADNIHVAEGNELIEACKDLGIIESVFPPREAASVHKQLFNAAMYSIPCDRVVVAEINDYFGSEVAMYFAFMSHFTMWLLPPAIFGSTIFLQNAYDTTLSVHNNPMVPVFSIFIIVWSVLFVQYLHQTCSLLSCKWGTLNSSHLETGKARPEFRGKLKISRVTKKMEKTYHFLYRIPQYFLSIVVTGAMLVVAFMVMVVSLNLQGYIHGSAMFHEYLHFPSISVYSEPGAYFDNTGGGPYPTVLPLLPVILHVVAILILNTLYRSIADVLTDLENHRTDQDYTYSIVMKRVFFEAFDCYVALFYLAFCEFNIVGLRTDLFGLYTTDSIRRLLLESVVPYMLHKFSAPPTPPILSGEQKNIDEQVSSTVTEKDKEKEQKGVKGTVSGHGDETKTKEKEFSVSDNIRLYEWESFDDYLEMVIAFGYITLFASAFPLASGLTLLCLIVETKSDMFKVFWVNRRPLPKRVKDIGVWMDVLAGLAYLSIVTNVFLFAFTTGQMQQLFPALYQSIEGAEAITNIKITIIKGEETSVWMLVFAFEHLMLVFCHVVTLFVPTIAPGAKTELERQVYAKRLRILETQASGEKEE